MAWLGAENVNFGPSQQGVLLLDAIAIVVFLFVCGEKIQAFIILIWETGHEMYVSTVLHLWYYGTTYF